MASQVFTSWGRVERHEHNALGLSSRHQPLPSFDGQMLTYGNGRSYGDSNLNVGGALLLGRQLDRFIDFDPATGLLRCEAGVLLEEIIRLALPQGWFPPVTPGTQFVTVGGAIANDVHGKNHHVAGSFGNHVSGFELLRSDGARLWCSPDENRELFAATMATLVEMDLESHDRLIAYVLGLSHALNIAFFTALAESGEAAPRLATLSSTTFDAQLRIATSVAGENPDLYFEIQQLNDYGSESLAALLYAVERLRSVVRAGDGAGFRALMERGRGYLETRPR